MANLLDEPDLDTSTKQENMETTQDEERAARRERRQRQKEEEDDPSLLDVQDEEEEGPITRSRSPTAGNTGESGQDATASGSPPPSAQSSLCTSPIDVSRSLRLPIFNRLA